MYFCVRSCYYITMKLHCIGCYFRHELCFRLRLLTEGIAVCMFARVLRFTVFACSVGFESVAIVVYSCPTNQVLHQKRLSTTEYLKVI